MACQQTSLKIKRSPKFLMKRMFFMVSNITFRMKIEQNQYWLWVSGFTLYWNQFVYFWLKPNLVILKTLCHILTLKLVWNWHWVWISVGSMRFHRNSEPFFVLFVYDTRIVCIGNCIQLSWWVGRVLWSMDSRAIRIFFWFLVIFQAYLF